MDRSRKIAFGPDVVWTVEQGEASGRCMHAGMQGTCGAEVTYHTISMTRTDGGKETYQYFAATGDLSGRPTCAAHSLRPGILSFCGPMSGEESTEFWPQVADAVRHICANSPIPTETILASLRARVAV
jgi:hypothetical protein